MMPKYSNFAIVASFFALWLDSFFSKEIQIITGFLLIFSFGILHGANDLQLIDKISPKKDPKSFYKILSYYITVVFAGSILFYLLPELALLLFIIVSAYHFGEQQWQNLEDLKPEWIKYLFQFVYGLLILLLLFSFHVNEVQKIVFEITAVNFPSQYILLLLEIFGILFIAICVYLYIYVENFKSYIFTELFYLLVFAVIFRVSSLIWGFAIYFIVWHSIPSMIDQIKFLNGSFNFNNFKKYMRSGFIYWIASLFGIALLYLVFRDEKIFNALFFSFLAAITFPHALVILKMFGRKD